MAKAQKFGENEYGITCLACGCGHLLKGWELGEKDKPFDPEKPTFRPSLLVTGYLNAEQPNGVCHSYITDGSIQYLDDCTHEYAWKTIELPEFGDYGNEG